MVVAITHISRNGYYKYNNNYYYRDSNIWYKYDNNNDYYIVNKSDDESNIIIEKEYIFDETKGKWQRDYNVPDELEENYKDFFVSKKYDSSYGIENFEDSSCYKEKTSSSSRHDSDYDSDYDWSSSDSWDSSYTDFDSDW